MNSTSLYEEYFDYLKKYEKRYGSQTLIMMMAGTFYELYEYHYTREGDVMENGEKIVGKCTELYQLIKDDPDVGQDLKRTKKASKKPHSKSNPYMVGIPKCVYDKWKNIFVTRGYTIVRIDQTDKTINNRKERVVSEIVTLGTLIQETDVQRSIVCIVYEKIGNNVIFGISNVDIITGTSSFNEFVSINDVERYITSLSPKEVIVYSLGNETLSFDFEHTFFSIEKEYTKVVYQEAVLRKVFQLQSNLDPCDELDFGQLRYAATSYVCLLQYLNEHHATFISHIQRPQYKRNEEYLHISHNTVYHLNLISNNQLELNVNNPSITSLFSVINHVKTIMGRRCLKERLLYPFTDIKKINTYYECIEEAMNINDVVLNGIPDLQKLHRLVLLKTISYTQLISLSKGYVRVAQLINIIQHHRTTHIRKILLSAAHKRNFATIIRLLRRTFDNESDEFPFIIRQGVSEVYDNLTRRRKELLGRCVIKCDDESTTPTLELIDGMYRLTTTKARATKYFNEYTHKEIKGGKVHIYTTEMYSAGEEAYRIEGEIEDLVKKIINDVLNELISHISTLEKVTTTITELDYIFNGAYIAQKYKYFRPTLTQSQNSFIEAKEIRHPIIERIIEEEYIPNDVVLRNNGMLLYGPNSIGKTSLTKAIGCSVILAQMGYFTPSKMTYSPYTNIHTRLSGNDNLFRHQSSFVLEMMELRDILKNAMSTSLILGDELCRGTETVSGTALTVSTLLFLLRKKCTFIFSTHMHQLPTISKLQQFIAKGELLIKHLHIRYDRELNTLIYDRKLHDGNGDSRYGIEIAESLNLDAKFMQEAIAIRKELDEENESIVATKTSRYSTKVYVDECVKCKSTQNLHTHHLKEQHLSDDQGFIGITPKNSSSNLIVVCNKCHAQIHLEHLQLRKLRSTKGLVLISS